MPISHKHSSIVATTVAAFAGGCLITAVLMNFIMSKSKKRASFPATTQDHSTTNDALNYPVYDYDEDPKGSFMKICDILVEEVIEELPKKYELPERETKYLQRMLEYNVKGGKMNRGLMVVETGVLLFGRNNVDNTTLCRLAVLGWAIEWLQAWLLVADDIMDSSLTRRGQPCWYKTISPWYIAINDAFTIEALVFQILKRHFAYDANILLQLWDLLLESTLQTELGQLSDTLCDVLGLQDLTPSRWRLIVQYKTSYYSFYLSVAFAMVLRGITKKEVYDAAREILIIMGVYFQAQDDYLDCFGTADQIGKVGTDIQDKKCGWLFTKAYHELCTKEQREYLDQHYGKCKVGTPEEQKIKDLYSNLGLPQLYEQYEQDSYDKIMGLRDSDTGATLAAAGVPWQVFETFLQKVYKRSM